MGRIKAIVGSYVGVLVFAAFCFLGAGTVHYGPGWRYVGLALLGTTFNHLLMPAGSALTEDRLARAGDGEAWDKRLLGAHALLSLVGFVVAGLDSGRYGWSGPVPGAAVAAGAAAMVAGQLLFAVAKRENAFFSSTVRIQTERGHAVCESGPYRFVRHPGYLGMLAALLAFPLVTEAYTAFVPVVLGAALLVVRTGLEDRFLLQNLPGYPEYARRTRWRLLPGVY